MTNQTHAIEIKMSLGDYDMTTYSAWGASAEEATIHLKEMMAHMPPEKLKKIAIESRNNLKQKAAETINF